MNEEQLIKMVELRRESIENYNKKRYSELLNNKNIIAFLIKNKLPNEFVLDNIAIFDRYEHSIATQSPYALVYEDGRVYLEIASANISEKEKELLFKRKYLLYCDIEVSFLELDVNTFYKNKLSANQRSIFNYLVNCHDNKKGIYLFGDFGVGKTFLSLLAVNIFVSSKKTVAFVKVSSFINKARHLVISDPYLLESLITKLKTVDILFFDDIGSEDVSSFSRDDILFNILDYRMERKKITNFTSNQDLASLANHYTYDKKEKEEQLKAKRLLERIMVLSKPYCLEDINYRHKNDSQ